MTHRTKARSVSAIALSLFTLLAAGAVPRAPHSPQQATTPNIYGQQPQTPDRRTSMDESIDSNTRASMEAQRQKYIAEDRHRKMAADADRLVKLAAEIKTEVDKTTKDELSVTVIKKTTEMEKLAHDIRSRMSN